MNRLNGLKRLTMIAAAAAMMMAALPAQATDYVFTYDGGYLAVDGANIVYTPTLTAQCVWHCVSSGNNPTATDLGSSDTRLYAIDAGGTTRWLVGSNSDGTVLSTQTSTPTARWRYSDNYLNFYRNRAYYVYYRGGSWRCSNSTNRNDNNNYYAQTNWLGSITTDYRSTVITGNNGSTTAYDGGTVVSVPTISPASATLESGDDEEFTASATATKITYTPPAHTTFTISAVTYYYYNNTIYTSRDAFSNRSETHPAVSYAWTKSGDGNTNLTLSSTNTAATTATHSSAVSTDKTVTLTVTASATGAESQTATATVYLLAATPEAPAIVRSGLSQAEISCPSMGVDIYYTVDGSTPTNGSTPYSGPFDLSCPSTTVKAVAIRNGHSSSTTTETLKCKLPTPVITLVGTDATIAAGDGTPAGTKLYYTTDGTTPTDASTEYTSGTVVLVNPQILTVIAIKDGYDDSDPAKVDYVETGINGSTVILDDREDHNWSYYQASGYLPAGYPTEYLSSPNPRNVKITYRGGSVTNASAVAISALDGEGQNEMIYYKTLEKSVPGMTGDYPYTVISNPFSKRPRTNGSNGNNGYWGFAGWKVISGGEYIAEYADNATLPLDATIHFTGLDAGYTPNCISAEIVFEATWTGATVKTGTSAQSFTGGTYETNFWVLTGNASSAVSVPANSTMSARYPDGTVSTNTNFTRAITAGGDNAKVEFVNMNSTQDVSAANHTFTMGRGIVNSGNGGTLAGCTSDADCEQTVKVESGTYTSLNNFTTGLTQSRKCDQLLILGCDYDRAKNDNTKLIIRTNMYVAQSRDLNRASNSLYVRTYVKSGNLGSTITVQGNNNYTGAGGSQTYYYSVSGNHNAGRRYLCVEGGRLDGIAGGMDATNSQATDARAFDLRVRGKAQIDGVVYGAAEFAGGRGIRTMVFTGGTVKGWVAAGANGTREDGGAMNGASYLYFGGKARLDSDGSQQRLNSASGGNLFGAGCGFSAQSSSGQVQLGTNVVVADSAYIERGVYGGGGFGFCTTTQTSNIFILGGEVEGVNGGITNDGHSGSGQYSTQTNPRYLSTIKGGVFGGACQNNGGTINIYMDGGLVHSGVYGGSNYKGNITSDVTMQFNGGTVGDETEGDDTEDDGIYGGGYGSNTTVAGNVSVTLGESPSNAGGVTVNGNVYGGSAEGDVNNSTSNTTSVTVNQGTVNGIVFGGAYGNGADVNGTITVNMHGGTVTRALYGGGDAAAYSHGGNYPVVNMTGGTAGNVFGGGRGNTAAVIGNPQVTLSGTAAVTGNVYGGGNAAEVDGDTKVTLRD